jgi:hypothetical protein
MSHPVYFYLAYYEWGNFSKALVAKCSIIVSAMVYWGTESR